MKKLLATAVLFLPACSAVQIFAPKEQPFYERAYALPADAQEWAKSAPLKDLCQGTKNWRHPHIREAALREIKERDWNTKACYYTGMELTP